MFCKHEYEIKAKVIARPYSIYSIKGISERALLELVQGKVTLIFIFKKCGEIIEKEYLGSEVIIP